MSSFFASSLGGGGGGDDGGASGRPSQDPPHPAPDEYGEHVSTTVPLLEDDEEVLRRMMQESRDASRQVIKSHLSTHLARNPDANFKSWIASLHPENVTLDPRLENANPEENEWLAIWAEAVSGRDTDAEVGGDEPATLTDAEAQTTSARQAQPLRGWGGLVDISLGVGLSLAAGGLAGGTELFYACVLWTARGAYAAYQSAAAMDGVLRIFAAIPGLVALVCWLVAWALLVFQSVFQELFSVFGLFVTVVVSLNPRQAWSQYESLRRIGKRVRCVAMRTLKTGRTERRILTEYVRTSMPTLR